MMFSSCWKEMKISREESLIGEKRSFCLLKRSHRFASALEDYLFESCLLWGWWRRLGWRTYL
jgi:hypothetical protein